MWKQYGFFAGEPRGNELVVARYDETAGLWRALGESLQLEPDVLALRPSLTLDAAGQPIVSWTENPDSPEMRSLTARLFDEGTNELLARWDGRELSGPLCRHRARQLTTGSRDPCPSPRREMDGSSPSRPTRQWESAGRRPR